MDTQVGRSSLFEDDEYAWIGEQIEALRAGRYDALDRENLVQFLSDMASRDRRELRSRLTILAHHLLIVAFQPGKASKSWALTIQQQQDEISAILEESRTLAREADSLLAKGYPAAVRRASRETGIALGAFPPTCPYTVRQMLEAKDGP